MILTLLGGLGLAGASATAAGQGQATTKKLRSVSGFLNAHWEYPGFLPDAKSGLRYMDFQIEEEAWRKHYNAPRTEAYIRNPDEEICFRIVGRGYITPRHPTSMQPWEGSRFIFVKVKKLARISEAECTSRMKANVR